MGFRINTNVTSLRAQTAIKQVRNNQDGALARLSSGFRINKSADDAAGLAISESLKASVRSSAQAQRNANDGISMIQVAEGGFNEIGNILVRLRELSIQSASDTVGDTERGFVDMEFQNLMQEMDRIANTTEFNGTKLINGTGDVKHFQIGLHGDGDSRLEYNTAESSGTASDLGVDGMSVVSKGDAQSNLERIDTAISNVNRNRANLGALQNRMQSTTRNLDIQIENMQAANSQIRDTDIAKDSAELAKANIVTQAATSVLAQANQNTAAALKLV